MVLSEIPSPMRPRKINKASIPEQLHQLMMKSCTRKSIGHEKVQQLFFLEPKRYYWTLRRKLYVINTEHLELATFSDQSDREYIQNV